MINKFLISTVLLVAASAAIGQDGLTTKAKHRDNFGLSFDMGGKMESAPDISTIDETILIGGYANAVGKKNIGFSLFWEHQWNFHKNHGLLFGVGASMTAFDYDIAFKNINVSFLQPTQEHILGSGFRNSFFSLDLPLYYTYSIHTKIGDFNPFVGVNVRNISYIMNQGRNNGGISGETAEVINGDTTYFNAYTVKFGTKNLAPALMPTFGVRYSRTLKDRGTINLHLTMKLMLNNSNSPEVYLNNYDNFENGVDYVYYQFAKPENYQFNQNGELIGPKSSIYYRINMTSFNVGVSYSFKK